MTSPSMWPLLVAAAAAVVLGSAWFHPRLFGRAWMREAQITPEIAERSARTVHLRYAVAFLGALMMAYVLRALLSSVAPETPLSAVRLAALLWLGFVAPVLLSGSLWEHRPFGFYFLNAGYWLLVLAAMSVILVV